MPVSRAHPNQVKFNANAELPYQLRLEDFQLAMQDVYDLLFDINSALVERGLQRLEETVRSAIFSGILSDTISASVARHSRVLTENRYHNGHPDLIPDGMYSNNSVQAGEAGVEIKATKGKGGVDTHGARNAWLAVFRYETEMESEPVHDRAPTKFVEVLLAQLALDDFRHNARGELGTRTASPNKQGLTKLRANWIY